MKLSKEKIMNRIEESDDIQQFVYDELMKLGFSPSCVGTVYTRDAIAYMIYANMYRKIDAKTYNNAIESVMSKYDLKSKNYVYMHIRVSLEHAMTYGDFDTIIEVCGYPADNRVVAKVFVNAFAIELSRLIDRKQDKKKVDDFRELMKNELETASLYALQTAYGILQYCKIAGV